MRPRQIIINIFCILILMTMATAVEKGTTAATGSTSTGTNACNPEQFPITDLDTAYAYGCIDTIQARSCRQSDGSTVSGNFKIPTSHPLLTRCSTPATTPPPPSTGNVCLDPSSSKKSQLDCVWNRISNFLDLETNKVNRIWDNSWKSWNEVYAPPPATYEGVEGNDAFDELIQFAANQHNVEPRAIKAIMLQESSGRPNAISNTGCVGLMQICLSSAPKDILVNICKQDSNTPQTCDGVKDDRFDPRKNLLAGAFIFKQKWDAIGDCGTDRLKATVAAYNAGEVVIKTAIAANNNNCNNWNSVELKITSELLIASGYTNDWISQYIKDGVNPNNWRTQKVNEIKGHVTGFDDYYARLESFQ